MMRASRLHAVLLHQQANFRACFPALDHQDIRAILRGEAEVLLERLQRRYGYAAPEAKAAWNDFVLRYVDGEEVSSLGAAAPQVRRQPSRMLPLYPRAWCLRRALRN